MFNSNKLDIGLLYKYKLKKKLLNPCWLTDNVTIEM